MVSDPSELLVLVDEDDNEIGLLDKAACHAGTGRLHRAISVFLMNSDAEVLIQQRHASKPLWPGFWSNACCSHPRPGETTAASAHRRVREELGLEVELTYAYKFEYRAQYHAVSAEHEMCSVFYGIAHEDPVINTTEIALWKWISPSDCDRELTQNRQRFTPWFQLEWLRLHNELRLI